jgi:hypothetical protein
LQIKFPLSSFSEGKESRENERNAQAEKRTLLLAAAPLLLQYVTTPLNSALADADAVTLDESL